MKAIEALYEAQKIAFGPFVFQTCIAMKELHVFDAIHKAKGKANNLTLSKELNISKYGIDVLIEMAEAADILELDETGNIELTKIGFFLHTDNLTNVNMMFTQDICYKGLYYLKDAIVNGKPEGLKELGPWKTIYEGLSKLTPKETKSWFEFDHYYSDDAFENALKIVFDRKPNMIFDIGGNTGKWSIQCCNYNENVSMKIIDLPGQVSLAKENISKNTPFKERVSYCPIDILDPKSEIPAGADIYWMSQFLDCFSEQEIEDILLKIKKNASKESKVFIMETFTDNQNYKAANFSLVATSLYFTAMANGNSRMYSKSDFEYIIGKAGFKIDKAHELIGSSFHTILECSLV
jgi:hypothetical protein